MVVARRSRRWRGAPAGTNKQEREATRGSLYADKKKPPVLCFCSYQLLVFACLLPHHVWHKTTSIRVDTTTTSPFNTRTSGTPVSLSCLTAEPVWPIGENMAREEYGSSSAVAPSNCIFRSHSCMYCRRRAHSAWESWDTLMQRVLNIRA